MEQNLRTQFEKFYSKHDINHNFSALRIPQQNGMVEKKNQILEEMARTMLCESHLIKYFWTEAVNTMCYILNRALIRPIQKKIHYELWHEKKLNIGYFYIYRLQMLYS